MDWMQVAERFGFPAAFVALLALGVWKSIKFLGLNVVKPAVDRGITMAEGLADQHKSFLAETLQHQRKIDECMDGQGRAMQIQSSALDEIKEQTVTQTQLLREVLANKQERATNTRRKR